MPRVMETDQPWKDDPLAAAKGLLMRASKVKVTPGGGTSGHNAFYGGCLATGKMSYIEHPCHAYTKSLVDCRVLFSRMVHSDAGEGSKTTKATKAYFRWITGPSSPWREVFPLGMSMSGEEFTQRFWWRHGFLFDKMDTVPANLLHNFLVATRTPKEWPHIILGWHQAVRAGCSEAGALFFQTMFTKEMPWAKHRDFEVSNTYDFPLDAITCTEEYFQNFSAGITPGLSKPFNQCKENGVINYWPVNSVWGENNRKVKVTGHVWHGNGYAFKIRDRYSKTVGKRNERVNKVWAGKIINESPIIDWSVTDEDMFEIIKQEERRLSLV